MPTLGEFIVRARRYGYTKHTIRIQELGAHLVYLRRGAAVSPKLVELPPIREGDRLTRAMVERLCRLTGIPTEDSSYSSAISAKPAQRVDQPHLLDRPRA
jgi:hypothetical protein